MLYRLLMPLALITAFAFSGCATETGMARLETSESVTKSTVPVYLMAVTLKNTLVPAYQPKLVALEVMQIAGRNSHKILLFNVDTAGRAESLSPTVGNNYLLRFQLQPGKYVILGLKSIGQSMFTAADFYTPLDYKLTVTGTGVRYLGHVDAVVRARKGDEFRASAAALPSTEQREIGSYGGTFDVEVSDRWDSDSVRFTTAFPALKDVKVEKAILPEFDRGLVQQWWEFNNFNRPMP